TSGPLLLDPTAQTLEEETAATAASSAPPEAPSASGTSAQPVPSQCSISARVAVEVPGLRAEPTAQTSLEEIAATALSLLSAAVLLRLGTTRHERPSQCSARVPPADFPTAQTSLGATAATPRSSLLSVPGLGLVIGDHLPPLHCSMRVGP